MQSCHIEFTRNIKRPRIDTDSQGNRKFYYEMQREGKNVNILWNYREAQGLEPKDIMNEIEINYHHASLAILIENLRKMEKELYYTNNKLISKLNIYFDANPSQFNNIMIKYPNYIKISVWFDVQSKLGGGAKKI